MLISVVNHTNGRLKDEDVQRAIRAVNRQIAEDFQHHWNLSATLRLEGKAGAKPDKINLPDLRGDAVIYLWDKTDVPGALGYHFENNAGIPFGFVFTDLAEKLKESWTVTLSHEALELLNDSETNLLVQGPHPANPQQTVFHWFEMCDAVQAETYTIDDTEVSNFVLPLYFTISEEVGGRNDFLGRVHDGNTLKSFGVNPGGYIGFFNPATNKHETFTGNDPKAEERLRLKQTAKEARRAVRYQEGIAAIRTARAAGVAGRR